MQLSKPLGPHCVQVLLTPLHYAASLGDAACVTTLLEHGADIHMLDQVCLSNAEVMVMSSA